MNDILTWIGIMICISQSAIFSGLNLAFFSLTRLRLEIEAELSPTNGAKNVLSMRKDSNFLLTTILWGNVGINVLLTLLSDSIMTGVVSFAFSTVIITFFGEIIPQAYFSRNALRMASLLSPVLKFYQILLFPVAKPCALMLDSWLGKESVQFFSEKNIKLFIRKHIEDYDSEIGDVEGRGAINFLSLDDKTVIEEGEDIIPASIINLKSENSRLIFPAYSNQLNDPFIQQINRSGEKWIIFTNEKDEPVLALDADGFIRSEVFEHHSNGIEKYCHKPLLVTDKNTNLEVLLKDLKSKTAVDSDVPIDTDVILFWTAETKRIITGADILGRLLKGI